MQHTGEQRPRGHGHRKHRTLKETPQRAHAPVNELQGTIETAHACTPRAAEGQGATNHTPRVGRTGAMQPTRRASSRSGTPRPLVCVGPGCIRCVGKHHADSCKQLVTGELVHSPGGGHLPSSEAPQLKPQG